MEVSVWFFFKAKLAQSIFEELKKIKNVFVMRTYGIYV